MKIGVMSDSHDRVEETNKAIAILQDQGCEVLIHCGDFCSPFMMVELAHFKGEVHCCFGNIDDQHMNPKKAEDCGLTFHGQMGVIEKDGKKIAFTHLPTFARGLASTQDYDVVLYGHTHKKHEERIGNTLFVNPGEIMGRLGKRSCAVYNTETDNVEFFDV